MFSININLDTRETFNILVICHAPGPRYTNCQGSESFLVCNDLLSKSPKQWGDATHPPEIFCDSL